MTSEELANVLINKKLTDSQQSYYMKLLLEKSYREYNIYISLFILSSFIYFVIINLLLMDENRYYLFKFILLYISLYHLYHLHIIF